MSGDALSEAPHVREIIPAIIKAGDVILFPQGHPHVMSRDPGLRAPVYVTS